MKRSIDLSLYLVTRREALGIEEFLSVIHAAVNGGVTVVQLREKEASARETIHLGKKLIMLLKPLGVPLIINDRVDIAHAIGADGVHLGQSDLSVSEARAILGKKAMIGISVESLQQAQNAMVEDLDYLAASPIFHTKTKTDCAEPWGLNGLKQLCTATKYPVVAIGGINETNVRDVMDCGASGVALVSAIFDAACPRSAARTVIQRMKKDAY
jgi:thiamine-phosphate pyrophosphorylase